MEMHSVFPVCRCPFLSGLSVTPKTQLPESRMGDFCFQLLSTDHLIAKTQFAEFNPVKNLPVTSNEMFWKGFCGLNKEQNNVQLEKLGLL